MLKLKRFCGEETYPLKEAKWYMIDRDLWIDMEFAEGHDLHEDTEYLAQEPVWELRFDAADDNILQKGCILTNENDEEEDGNFYYCEHIPTFHNVLEVLDRKEDEILFKINAVCCDVNYYDGSKGNDELELTAWIRKKQRS